MSISTGKATIEIESTAPRQVIDITDLVAGQVTNRGDGLCHLFCRHTTAGLMVVTGEEGVPEDILDVLSSLIPPLNFRHASAEHVSSHFLSALARPDLTVPVEAGRLGLGEFQRIVLMEFEGARRRQIDVRFSPLL